MLSVMEPLVSYGFYWNYEDIIEIINVLIDILDGTSDRPKASACVCVIEMKAKMEREKAARE